MDQQASQHTKTDVEVELQTGSRHQVTIVKVTGPLTIRNFFEFQDLTRSQKSPVLIIDLTDVPYLDSAALGSLLGLHLSCTRANRRYGLASVSDRIRTMITVCGVQDVLAVFPSVAEAEAALA
jgi:anti-anti-sigma factor